MATSMYIQAGVVRLHRAPPTTRTCARCASSWRRGARSPTPRSRAAGRSSLRADPKADGYYVWATAPRELRARALLASAERRGASFLFGEAFFAQSGGDGNFRLALTPVPRERDRGRDPRIGAAVGG